MSYSQTSYKTGKTNWDFSLNFCGGEAQSIWNIKMNRLRIYIYIYTQINMFTKDFKIGI